MNKLTDLKDVEQLPMRPAAEVMNLSRLGRFHQTRLSFMRALVRKMMAQHWQIHPSLVELDEHGYGTMVYRIDTPNGHYHYVLFSDYLADDERNDRVIAEKWDVTMALCIGDVSDAQLAEMRLNVPKQEAGRASSNMMVLSRGNKSSRNFSYVVDALANGEQPAKHHLANCGYLYRTTAVYGSGKFGMADWEKVRDQCVDFAAPFAAEMFNCFMLRHFSIDQAEHLARIQSPGSAVAMDDGVKRFIGIGNSTGLGMAPYLIRHPKLISRWVLNRESALARVIYQGEVTPQHLEKIDKLLSKAITHISETRVPDEHQIANNELLLSELGQVQSWLSREGDEQSSWELLVQFAEQNYSFETQEMLNSLLLELYPELVSDISYECVDEVYRLQPEMSLEQLKHLIEARYDWALEIDFGQADANHFFWYRSEEKMEPRLGERANEPGADREMPLTIARLVRQCYDALCEYVDQNDKSQMVAYFLLNDPKHRGIVKRIQTMSEECYGEIRANLADIDMLPMDLLRCKLSFFGVSKFDPKSKLWVRNTMFQGAPLVSEIVDRSYAGFKDDWCFPISCELDSELQETGSSS